MICIRLSSRSPLGPNYMSLGAFYGKSLGAFYGKRNFYGKFCCICEEIALSESITYDISAMNRKHESMWVARFLSTLASSFDGVCHILRAKELPSLTEVFSRLRLATLTHVAQSPTDHFALAASVRPNLSPRSGFGHVSRSDSESS